MISNVEKYTACWTHSL